MQQSNGAITLGDVTDQYMLMTFNQKRVYYPNFLFHAKNVWRDIFLSTAYAIKTYDIAVYQENGRYYINKPKDLVRLTGIQAKFGNEYKPLLLSDQVRIAEPLKQPDIKCKKCNNDDLCEIISSKVVSREETFNGQQYTLKTFFKTTADGVVHEEEEYMVYDEEEDSNIKQVRSKNVCNLEISNCGCVNPTLANVEKIEKMCGCYVESCQSKPRLPNLYSPFGYYNYSISGNRIYLMNAQDVNTSASPLPNRVEASFQTDGESDIENVLVPVYALNTMFKGMKFGVSSFRNMNTAEADRKEYNRAKEDLLKFLFPLDLDAFFEAQSIQPKI